MEKEKIKGVIEAILFASGRVVKIRELMSLLEINSEEIISSIAELEKEYATLGRGLEIVRVEDGYQLASKRNITNIYILCLAKEQNQHYLKHH